MGLITAFECDVCHRVSKEPMQFSLPDGMTTEEFIIRRGEWATINKCRGCCSFDCVRKALELWLENREYLIKGGRESGENG